jgi:hypothetical protein
MGGISNLCLRTFSCKVKLSPAAPAVFISHLNVYYFTELGTQLLSIACIILKKEPFLGEGSLITEVPELTRRSDVCLTQW